MQLGKLIGKSQPKTWFRLDQLLESVLADAISADANFQLTQVQAWRDFGHALAEFGQIPTVDRIDLAVGFGRQENLGLSELSVSLPVQVYSPGWWRRAWWGIVRIFGGTVPSPEQRFRLARAGNRGVIELCIKASRTQQGRWTVSEAPHDDSTQAQPTP